MYQSILVPLDGSTFGEHALPFAVSIAQHTGAAIQLVHVHVAAERMYSDSPAFLDPKLDLQLRERERMYLAQVAERLDAHVDVPTTLTLLEGLPIANAIRDHAVATGVDLVVMTTHGRGSLSRFWLGNVAHAFVHHATMPVLLMRPLETELNLDVLPGFKHILITLDGSPFAEQVLAHAVALGKLTGAHYTLLRVVEPVIASYGSDVAAVEFDKETRTQLYTTVQTYLDTIADSMRAEELDVRTVIVEEAQPGFAILDYVRDHPIDLIAMATHGRSGFTRLLLGSVADKVVRGATVPVLLHRPHSHDRHH